LRLVVGAEHPDDAYLPFLNRRGRRHGAIGASVGAAASTGPGSPAAVRRSLLAASLIASVSRRSPFSAACAVGSGATISRASPPAAARRV
jgi:hypothetical protein